MVDRDAFSGHIQVCPTLVALLAGSQMILVEHCSAVFFPNDSFVHAKCHDAEPGNPWMLKTEAN